MGILAGTFLGMGGMKSAEAINNAWWTDTPETLVTGQIKTTDIEDNETIGTADNYYIINGNGNIGLNNRENAILTVSQGTVNYSEVNGGIIEVSAHGYPDHTNLVALIILQFEVVVCFGLWLLLMIIRYMIPLCM